MFISFHFIFILLLFEIPFKYKNNKYKKYKHINNTMSNSCLFCTEMKFLRRNSPCSAETKERRAVLKNVHLLFWFTLDIDFLIWIEWLGNLGRTFQ